MLQAHLQQLRCNIETDEIVADEPYVLVSAVRLRPGPPPTPPAFEVFKYGPFEDVDQGESRFPPDSNRSFWSLPNGNPAFLRDPEDVIFIVSLMEHDDGDPDALRTIVKGSVGASLTGSLSFSRPDKVAALLRDVNGAMGTPTGGPNFDDKIGGPQELRWDARDLQAANELGEIRDKTLQFRGDGGDYTLTFRVSGQARLRSFNHPGRFIRHRNFLGELTQVTTDLDKRDSLFDLHPGLLGGTVDRVSLRSKNPPDHFLRHQNFRLKLQKRPTPGIPDALQFDKDATFFLEAGLADRRGMSFRSFNHPNHYIRHRNFELFVERRDSPNLAADATFFNAV